MNFKEIIKSQFRSHDNIILLLFSIIIYLKVYFLFIQTNSVIIRDTLVNNFFFISLHFIIISAFMSIPYLFSSKYRLYLLFFLNLFLSLIFNFDLLYYRAFEDILSFYQLYQVSNLDGLSGAIFSMFKTIDILFYLDIPLLLFFYYLKKDKIIMRNRTYRKTILFIGISCVYIYVSAIIFEKQRNVSLFEYSFDPNTNINRMTPIGYHLFDLKEFLFEVFKKDLTSEERNEIKQFLYKHNESSVKDSLFGILKGYNLILIQVESLEKFVVDDTIDRQEITPYLNSLKNKSLYFSNLWEQIKFGGSSDADLMINTGVFPIQKGSTLCRFPNNTYNSLPKILKDSGYSTIAMKSDKGNFYNWYKGLKGIGFEKCLDYYSFKQDDLIRNNISDSSFLQQITSLICKEKFPFYLFLSTITSHCPFEMPKDKQNLRLDEQLNKNYLGQYFQSLNYTDRQISSFLNKLDELGILDKSLVVIYGDHTGIHKFYPDEVAKLKHSQECWRTKEKKMPLIFYSPKLKPQIIAEYCGQIDFMPTILHLLGVDQDRLKNTCLGRNLFTSKKNYVVLGTGEVLGVAPSKTYGVDCMRISNKIISGNYFKNYINK